MDKRTLLAFVLSFLVLFIWSVFFGTPKQQTSSPQKAVRPQNTQVQEPEVNTQLPSKIPGQVTDATPSAKSVPISGKDVQEKTVVINTPYYEAVFSSLGPTIKSFKLKKYRETVEPDSPLVNLIGGGGDKELLNVSFIATPSAISGNTLRTFEVGQTKLEVDNDTGPKKLVFKAQNPDGGWIQKTYTFFPDQYRIHLKIETYNQSQKVIKGAFVANINATLPEHKKGYYAPFTGLLLLNQGELEQLKLKKKKPEKILSGKIQWVAYQRDYFLSAVVPDKIVDAVFKARLINSRELLGTYKGPEIEIGPLESAVVNFNLFLGPRELSALKQVGGDLDRAIDFGWTDIIAKPLLYALKFFNQYIHNYGVSIILLTILIKIIFWPLTHKSYKSMKEMQKLQPRLAKIREKYKDNREQMNKEMMALYKTYKVNPMSGCLPMIIQIPVFFALYRILGQTIELRHAPFMLWINDLSAPDRLFHFSFKIPFMAPPYGIPVLTLLMGASMFIQQKMTPTPGDPTQAKFMMFLPIIFTFMFINFPSGLVLYWLVNNILSIGQQYRIHKRLA